MREILFRGKLKGTGNCWSYGNLNVNVKGVCIITPDDTPIGKYGQVIPETVGQYTGLTDKNGKKIFEGDIVQAYFRNNHSKQIFCVVFNDGMFLFDNNCVSVPKYDIYAMAVIGNIHDNPELLKEGAD